MRKIDCAYRNVCSIVRIISGQRNIGISAHRAGKKSAAKIDNLQSIIGEQQSRGDAIERQSFSEKIVVHPARVVDRNLEMRVLAAAKWILVLPPFMPAPRNCVRSKVTVPSPRQFSGL